MFLSTAGPSTFDVAVALAGSIESGLRRMLTCGWRPARGHEGHHRFAADAAGSWRPVGEAPVGLFVAWNPARSRLEGRRRGRRPAQIPR